MKLVAPKNRVVVKVDMEFKNSHTFSDGKKIRIERSFDNFNMRYVNPVNAIIISSHVAPEGAEVLIHHNSTHDTYRIFNYQPPTEEASSDVRYFSIPEEECFFWRKDGSTWNPFNNFVTALRLFSPYTGVIKGVPPSLIKDRLLITSGSANGEVAITLKASDYEIIYQDEDGREHRMIRMRYYDGEDNVKNEVIAFDYELTKKVKSGKVLVGLTPSDAKQYAEYAS